MEGLAGHWEAAAPRSDHARCDDQVREIDAYHRSVGYAPGTAYTKLYCNHGGIFVGRGFGRLSAATCNSFWNSRYWSACWLGGPGHTPTPEALSAFATIIGEARALGAHKLIGHQQACATACPGPDLMHWIRVGLPGPLPPAPSPTQGDTTAMYQGQDGTIHLLSVGAWRYPSPGEAKLLEDDGVRLHRNQHPWAVIAAFKAYGCWDTKRNGPIPETTY